MRVLHIAFECAPMFKTGGLGDVVGSLPIALSRCGVDVQVAMPGYSFMDHPTFLPGSMVPVHYMPTTYFRSPDDLRNKKKSPTGFAEFVSNLITHLRESGEVYDILHCHDWHMGLLPYFIARHKKQFPKTKTIITLHNIGYQGKVPQSYVRKGKYADIFGDLTKSSNDIPYLKVGIEHADLVTTVSPHHATEIKRGVIGANLTTEVIAAPGKFYGVLNGINYTEWDSRKDSLLHAQYGIETLEKKQQNKLFLKKQLGLSSANVPLFAFVGRLSTQKGLDLLLPQIFKLLKLPAQFVLLGSGDEYYEKKMKAIKKIADKKMVSLNITFSEALAHQIYAGADFLLIPSVYEPCGLIQMIGMRYGTIPVASAVGGLVDSIQNEKTGFLFSRLTKDAFTATILKAATLYLDQTKFVNMQKEAMRQDFSWDKSASEYVHIYKKLIERK